MASRIDIGGFTPGGRVTTSLIDDGALAATAEGRAKMAPGFFDRNTVDRFAEATFQANRQGRIRFADGFIDARLLANGVLSADELGRKKMAIGYFSSATLDKFSVATFTADNIGRSKFADGFISTNLLADNVLSASTLGRAKIAAGFFDLATVTTKFTDHSIRAIKLLYAGETYDFSGAVALRAKDPVAPSDVVTKAYLEANGGGGGGGPVELPWIIYKLIDPVADAVTGQPNTYYIDLSLAPHGYNVQLDDNDIPAIKVLRNSLEKLWTAAADLASPTIPGDFTVVRSMSTGPEGPAPVGSLNAVKFTAPVTTPTWIEYRRASPDSSIHLTFRYIDLIADAVPGQPNAYYVDKGASVLGHNVHMNGQLVPEIELVKNGRKLLWTTPANLGSLSIPGDFTVVPSASTGPEGPAPAGSLNAILLDAPLSGDAWLNYHRMVRNVDSWFYYRRVNLVADAVTGQSNTFYIDRGPTDLGYDAFLDEEGLPEIRVVQNGRDLLWVEEADLGNPSVPGDFTVVRSMSVGPEGVAAVGSKNAIKLALFPAGSVWVHYRRKGLASA